MSDDRHIHKKRFGQHFLHDPGLLRKIVQAIDPKPGERIVEIGPGDGALTLPLLRALGRLTVIELDRDLIPRLRAAAEGVGELEILHADVLGVDFTNLAQGGTLRVVGNLPYNISSPILFHCLDHVDSIRDMHFMLQKEVVDRMAAAPGSKVYGRLSVMLQLACRVEPLLAVPPGAFRPPPKVDSAVVRLIPRAAGERPAADAATIARIVKAAFGQRRKTLANALHGLVTGECMQTAGVDPKARAEQLAPAAFVALAQALAASADESQGTLAAAPRVPENRHP
ncbi:16S rRNA (adenine(1518)-N(6)/adenine(1519)-N(6))-dimethyltransferase RsmA [Dokdonella sp.]|uniref:16S rRNA (adenine(1518)-N(6)/adenine(1519)-N(6))- dimethyltransferase RsmA n=1 Tax=Dokdonella sp. TaxID=2291710 RepID=UPI001B1620D1|nr:16S rRNA (adenine(1518)-N(6)/adenine(1519)-N(6))-dimethyltransferase RsmA [Dokdonella sp.]MBO9663825.1 16S rRNA (adenine(1518)-N(6)/adenine(1519)-N(6))-dimethyltransferase RsmA [Dokdonella sp.]